MKEKYIFATVIMREVISNTISPEDIDLSSTSTRSQDGTWIDCETQTVSYKDLSLRRKIKTLKQMIKSIDVKILSPEVFFMLQMWSTKFYILQEGKFVLL